MHMILSFININYKNDWNRKYYLEKSNKKNRFNNHAFKSNKLFSNLEFPCYVTNCYLTFDIYYIHFHKCATGPVPKEPVWSAWTAPDTRDHFNNLTLLYLRIKNQCKN